MFIGVFTAIKERKLSEVLLFVYTIIYFAVATGTVAYERYRVPVMPYIIILSCYGIIQLQRRFREYKIRRKTNKISSQ